MQAMLVCCLTVRQTGAGRQGNISLTADTVKILHDLEQMGEGILFIAQFING